MGATASSPLFPPRLADIPSSPDTAGAERELAAPLRTGAVTARRLVKRDREIVTWLSRQRFASAAQVAERFGLSFGRARRRLGQLAALGLIRREQPFSGASVYLVSADGLLLAESPLPAPTIDIRTFRHDLGIADLAIQLELEGLRTATEREMRFREANGLGTYAARFSPDPRLTSPRRHFADLAVEFEDGIEVFELELTPKRTSRLHSILKAYRRSPHVSKVVYYVERQDIARRLEEIARTLHLDGRLEVRWW
jgi:hypothetical protein